MAIESGMYTYRNPWQGPVSGSVQRGMTMGDMIRKRQKKEAINSAFKKNMRKNPDGSVSFDRASLLSELAGLDSTVAMKTEEALRNKDIKQEALQNSREDRKNMLDQRRRSDIALALSEVKTPQDYIRVREMLSKKGVNTSGMPAVNDPNFNKQAMTMGFPTYLDKAKIDAGVGAGMNPYQMARLQLAMDNARRADQKFGFQVDKWRDQEMDEKAKLQIPGYERTGEVMQSPTEAAKLREAAAGAEQMIDKLGELGDLVDKHGSYQYFGDAGTRMQSLATEIQLLAKNQDMYNLGVLTGPDLMLLEKITSSPDSMNSLFTKNSTRKAQIQQQLKSIQSKLASKMRASGYRKAGQTQTRKTPTQSAPTPEGAAAELRRRMMNKSGGG